MVSTPKESRKRSLPAKAEGGRPTGDWRALLQRHARRRWLEVLDCMANGEALPPRDISGIMPLFARLGAQADEAAQAQAKAVVEDVGGVSRLSGYLVALEDGGAMSVVLGFEDEEQAVGQLEDDPLAQPAEAADGLPVDRVERRVEGPDEERVGHPHTPQRPPGDPAVEAVEVDHNVGQFGHGYPGTRRPNSNPG